MSAGGVLSLLLGVTVTGVAAAQVGAGSGAGTPGGAGTGMTNAPIAGPNVVNPANPNLNPNPGLSPSPGPIAPNSAPPPNNTTTLNNTSMGFRLAPRAGQNAPDMKTVLSAQQALTSQGYAVSTDGILGTNTQGAIRQFQANNGLEQNGLLDSETMRALGISSSPGPVTNTPQ